MAVMYKLCLCRLKENLVLLELILVGFLATGISYRILGNPRKAFRYLSQVHRSSRTKLLRSLVEPYINRSLFIHTEHRVVKASADMLASLLGARILVLKPKVSASEKGVLMVMFSETLPVLPNMFQMDKLMEDYILVFEPSWSGYCTEDILVYTKYQQPVFLLGKHIEDNRFIDQLGSNLVSVDLGASDWVDPNIALPFLGKEKQYDVVMNANWGEWKRHHILFKAISRLEQKISVALIGFQWGKRTRADIEELAKYYGVHSQLNIFEKVPFEKVMEINCQSRVAILLSLKEGANRAIPEALFCDIPAIVLKNNIGGQVRNIVTKTGILSTESRLGEDIVSILENPKRFSPRLWALENISCIRSTAKLNSQLKKTITALGENWTRDIAIRANSPDVTYYNKELLSEYESYGSLLTAYLK
jgi:glycosyltransferase involved in cell wall biosynthesis